MLFNSTQFIIFFGVVFALYLLLPQRFRWLLLLGASYVFYASWDVRFLGLIFFSTVVSYTVAILLTRTEQRRQRSLLLAASVIANLSVLLLFKYADFFLTSLAALLTGLGVAVDLPILHLILPVGISFYTFQTVGYIIDVYKGACEAERNFGRFALYVAFFPQLVAGPIERAAHLLPQLRQNLAFDYDRARDGLRLIVWGYFLKMVVADNLTIYINPVFDDPTAFTGAPLILATIFFSFQIYGDFAGYSYIAIGVARLLGVTLMQNFRQPYLATSIPEFWRHWHISLTTWFRDYLYLPMSRVPAPRRLLALFLVFVVSGLWHGAAWTFVVWGAIHGALFVIATLINMRRRPSRKQSSPALTVLRWLGLNTLVGLAWIFFRANTLADAWYIVTHLHLIKPVEVLITLYEGQKGLFLIGLVMLCEFTYRVLLKENFESLSRPVRWAAYVLVCLMIFNLSAIQKVPFIYFQF